MGFVEPWWPCSQHLPTQLQTWINWGTALKTINALIVKGAIKKPSTLATTFRNPAGKENMYVRFLYIPLTILNHTRRQVSVSMNADPINMIHISQQPTKEGLDGELEGDFRSFTAINWIEQVWWIMKNNVKIMKGLFGWTIVWEHKV